MAADDAMWCMRNVTHTDRDVQRMLGLTCALTIGTKRQLSAMWWFWWWWW